jgi:hypothetical protein
MYLLFILLVVLIGGTFIVCAALMPFSSERGRGWRRWLAIAASCLLVVGAAGFFGSALSAVGRKKHDDYDRPAKSRRRPRKTPPA